MQAGPWERAMWAGCVNELVSKEAVDGEKLDS